MLKRVTYVAYILSLIFLYVTSATKRYLNKFYLNIGVPNFSIMVHYREGEDLDLVGVAFTWYE